MRGPIPQRPVFALFAGLIGFAVAAFAPQIFHDGDSWWHIAAGGWMLDHQAVLKADVFSLTFFGQPWDAQEYLSEILMALAYRLGEWTGLHLLFGAAMGATCAIVTFYVRGKTGKPALLVALVGLACISGSLLARPHLLALPLLALWTFGLLEARDQRRAPHWGLLGVMLLWANMHGSFAFGLALACAFALEAVLENRGVIKDWAAFLLGAVIAATLTPQLLHGLVFPFQLLLLGSIHNIGEWAPTRLTEVSPLLIALAGLVWLGATRQMRLSVIRVLIIGGLAGMALLHARHQMLFGIVAAMIVARALGPKHPPGGGMVPGWLMPAGWAALAVLLAARLLLPTGRGDDAVTPMTALAQVPDAVRAQPVLNAYDFGGYLIFSGVKVFVDGRTDMYGDAFLAKYDAAMKPDAMALGTTLAKYKIGWTLLPPGPAAKMMDGMPGWRRTYRDAFAVVHVRN